MNGLMASLLIKNGTILDPSRNLERKGDLFIKDGKIAAMATGDKQIGSSMPAIVWSRPG
jgi:dihydroorotase-like cyclic amidohydrolase